MATVTMLRAWLGVQYSLSTAQGIIGVAGQRGKQA